MKPAYYKIAQRLLAAVLGLVAAACLLETGLRLCGWRIDGAQARRILHGADTAAGRDYTILCLGDSDTYGLGAPPGMDWPSQLQDLCRRNGYRVHVINAGILSANTHVGWLFLKEHLAALRPDLVTILTHQNNWWYLYGFNQYQYGDSLGSRLDDGLRRIRLVKLLGLLVSQLREPVFDRDNIYWDEAGGRLQPGQKPEPALLPQPDTAPDFNPQEAARTQQRAVELLAARRYAEAMPLFQSLVEGKPDDDCVAGLNTCFVQTHALPQAYAYWASVFKRRPHVNWNAYALTAAKAYENGDFDAYAELAVGSIENNPDRPRYYHLLFANEKWDFKQPYQRRIVEALRALAPHHTPAREALRSIEALHRRGETAIEDWTVAQLRDMVRLCRRHGCRVYLQDYLRYHNTSVRTASRLEDAPLIDHFTQFRQRPREEWPGYFVPDGHPNARGYAVMAEEVFQAVQPDLPASASGR